MSKLQIRPDFRCPRHTLARRIAIPAPQYGHQIRDLSIIALLLLILICGTQYLSYSERQNFAADTSSLVGFLDAIIENQKVEKQDIIVNSTRLSNGMIIGIKSQYYEVHFNQDFSAYTLTPINLVNNNIELIDKE